MKTPRLASLLLLAALTVTPLRVIEARALPAAAAQGDLSAKAPAVVFIIRHAEKPGDKDPNLSPTGFKRADLIPTLFLPQPGSTKHPRLPRPDFLFATAPSKHSNRPIETITPLSKALNLHINDDFSDDDAIPLAKEVLSGKYAGKVVLIAWHHGEIPHVAEAFGVTNAPHHWDETVFDQIWMLEWIDGKVQFTVLPEELLPGDSTK